LVAVRDRVGTCWADQLAEIVVAGPDAIRMAAFELLAAMAPTASSPEQSLPHEAREALQNGVSASRHDVRILCKVLLSSHGVGSFDHVPDIAASMRHKNHRVRLIATRSIGSRKLKTVELLVERLRDPEPDVVAAAAERLGQWGIGGEFVVTELVHVVRLTASPARPAAAEALASFPSHASLSIPCLVDALHESYEIPHPESRQVLSGRGHEWAARALRALLESADMSAATATEVEAVLDDADRWRQARVAGRD